MLPVLNSSQQEGGQFVPLQRYHPQPLGDELLTLCRHYLLENDTGFWILAKDDQSKSAGLENSVGIYVQYGLTFSSPGIFFIPFYSFINLSLKLFFAAIHAFFCFLSTVQTKRLDRPFLVYIFDYTELNFSKDSIHLSILHNNELKLYSLNSEG